MNGAQAVVEVLKREGATTIFGYPGGMALPLYDALYDSGIRHILTRHEQGAAHAADGFARATGKVGVCISTSGPGATNLVTGIATANMDSVPMVCITCQVPRVAIGKDSFQEADIRGITTPITKHNYLIQDPNELVKRLRQAFYVARSGRPGVVVVDIPRDIFISEMEPDFEEDIAIEAYKPLYEGDLDEVREAAALIATAKKPLFFVGGGANGETTAALFRELVKKTGIPVVNSLMGTSVFPHDDKLYLGMLGMHGTVPANRAAIDCDLLIGAGVRFADRVTGKVSDFAKNATIVQLEIDPVEINKTVKADVRVLADLEWSLKELLKIVKKPEIKEWQQTVKAWKAEKPVVYGAAKGDEIKPQKVIESVSALTKGEAVVVTDVGQHQMWSALLYETKNPRSFLSSGGLGTMGYGLPAAVGAQIGRDKEEVWVFVGDGGFLMNCQEMATAVEHQLPIKIVILNNRCLGMVQQWQRLFFDNHMSQSQFCIDTNFAKLAEAFGANGERITREKDLKDALKRAKKAKGPYLLDIMVTPDENVFPMVPAGASLKDMMEWRDY